MNTTPQYRPGTKPSNVPAALWTGLAIAVAGFALRITTRQITVDDSGYSCSYHDYAGYLVAAGILVCVVVAWAGRPAKPVSLRLATPLMVALTVVLLALAVFHVLRGTGAVFNACDGHPLP
jgi:hypothetical protein